MRLKPWDNDQAKKELSLRLQEASDFRGKFEGYWEKNEQLMFDAEGNLQSTAVNSSPEYGSYLENSGLDSAQVNQNSAYAFKNLRYIHSQMSANPPSVIAEPTTSDPDDRLAASAADRLVSHGRKTYQFAEKIDLQSLATLTYGIGYFKLVWDSSKGEIVDVDEEGNLTLEGDLTVKIPSVWDVFLDQHAESKEEVRYIFHRMFLPLEQAQAQWPEHKETLKKASSKSGNDYRPEGVAATNKPGREVEIYEYWEKGLPENGFDGRYVLHLRDGTVLGKVQPNPHRFLSAETIRQVTKKYGDLGEDIVEQKLAQIPQKAELPFHILTDIDVPQTVYGKSTLDYVGPIQDNLNRLMMTSLDNAAAHGAVQMIIGEANEIANDSIVNTPFNIIKVSGGQGPYQLQMPALLGDLGPMMDREKRQIDDIMGVNESMFGQMSRETANAALQSAAAQGSMMRRRLFNKYTAVVEEIYKQYLKLVRKHIDVDRLYHIIGREHPLEALEVKTMDLDGGYTVKVTYGESFSLDPLTRQAQIMQLYPILKENIPPSTLVDMLQLNELKNMYDENRVAKERQMEIIDEMIETGVYIPPEENQNHVGMLATLLEYVMKREYFDLDEDSKRLITKHIEDRKAMGAQEVAPM
jgi:hypothetical protein